MQQQMQKPTISLGFQVLVALFGGALIGLLLSPEVGLIEEKYVEPLVNWLALPGMIFLGALKMIVAPLVLVAVISGVTSTGQLGLVQSLGWRVVIYFLITTTIAVALGSAFATLLAPGQFVDQNVVAASLSTAIQVETAAPGQLGFGQIPNIVSGLVPGNPFAILADGNLLQIVIFGLVSGLALLAIPKTQSKPILQLVDAAQSALMKIVQWTLLITPYAVIGLVAKAVHTLGWGALTGLAAYMGTVVLALLVMVAIYAVVLVVVARQNVFVFFKAAQEPQSIAFATSSSAATMPVTLRTALDKLNIKPAVAKFIVPLGATINMDGTALYQAVATVFLAQVFGVDLGVEALVTVLAMAIVASIGAPGLPGASVVILASILLSIGVPAEGIALILGVDRLLDMCRTTVNVTGDLTAASVMNRILPEPKAK